MGSVFVACDRKKKLAIMPATAHTDGHSFVKPADSFRNVDQSTSSPPAMKRYTHAIPITSKNKKMRPQDAPSKT